MNEKSLFNNKKKGCTYRVSVSGSRLGKRLRFSIMDKLLIRWELGLFLCPPPRLPSIHPVLPPILCHPSCLPPIQDVSHSPGLDSYIRMPKRTWRLCVDRTTFELFDSFIFSLFTFFFFFFFPSSRPPPRLIICRVERRVPTPKHAHTQS